MTCLLVRTHSNLLRSKNLKKLNNPGVLASCIEYFTLFRLPSLTTLLAIMSSFSLAIRIVASMRRVKPCGLFPQTVGFFSCELFWANILRYRQMGLNARYRFHNPSKHWFFWLLAGFAIKSFTETLFTGIIFTFSYHLGTSCYLFWFLSNLYITGYPDGFFIFFKTLCKIKVLK